MRSQSKDNIHPILLLLILFIASLLNACDEQTTLLHAYRPVSLQGWQRNDTLTFPLQVTDSVPTLHVAIEMRHTNDYPYQNLALALTTRATDSLYLSHTDTLNLTLSHANGYPLGASLNHLYQLSVPVGQLPITYPGTYTLIIQHAMQRDTLPGISDIGIKISR